MEGEENREWPKLDGFEGRKLVRECLDSTLVGSLATHGSEGSWSATIYFTYDDGFNVYFVSTRSTLHIRNILEDNVVGFSAFSPLGKPDGALIGVQLKGIAIPVEESEIGRVYAEREKRIFGGAWQPQQNETLRMELQGTIFMKIKPQDLYYVNTSLFGGDRKRIPLDITK